MKPRHDTMPPSDWPAAKPAYIEWLQERRAAATPADRPGWSALIEAARADRPTKADLSLWRDIAADTDSEVEIVSMKTGDVLTTETLNRVLAIDDLYDALELAQRHVPAGAMEYSEGDHGNRVYVADVIRAALTKVSGRSLAE